MTWTRPMADEQRHLARLRWRVTELCVLRAWSRGRRHCARLPDATDEEGAAWHAKVAERVAKDYEVPVDTNAAVADAEGAVR